MYDCIAPREDQTKAKGRESTGVSEKFIGFLSDAATRGGMEKPKEHDSIILRRAVF